MLICVLSCGRYFRVLFSSRVRLIFLFVNVRCWKFGCMVRYWFSRVLF